MNPISRRNVLAGTAAGGLVSTATLARAKAGDALQEMRRPGKGGSNPNA